MPDEHGPRASSARTIGQRVQRPELGLVGMNRAHGGSFMKGVAMLQRIHTPVILLAYTWQRTVDGSEMQAAFFWDVAAI